MRFLFHCQFGGPYGWGHLVRSSTIAQIAKSEGHEAVLWTNSNISAISKEINHTFTEICDACPIAPIDIAIFDDHQFTHEDLREISFLRTRPKVVVLDDEAKRDLSFADVIINPALDISHFEYPAYTKKLIGARYALLRAPFRNTAGATKRTLISIILGGTDVLNLAPMLLECLSQKKQYFPEIALISPPKKETEEAIHSALKTFPQSDWYQNANASQIATVFARSKAALTACGGTAYEVAAMQTPFVGITVAENQRYASSAIREKWDLPVLDGSSITPDGLFGALAALPSAPKQFADIDGLGAQRVYDALVQ